MILSVNGIASTISTKKHFYIISWIFKKNDYTCVKCVALYFALHFSLLRLLMETVSEMNVTS